MILNEEQLSLLKHFPKLHRFDINPKIPPELNFGQEMLHGDLQCLHYDLVGMNKLAPKISEVMLFQKQLIVMLILEKNL
jgi:hypothetical protein